MKTEESYPGELRILRQQVALGLLTLKKIADPRLRDHQEPDAYTQLGCVMNMAEEAAKEIEAMPTPNVEHFTLTQITFPDQFEPNVSDMYGRPIKVGDKVHLYGTIGDMLKEGPKATGIVQSLSGMSGNPDRPMVWIDGQAAHHPKACEVVREDPLA